MAFGVGVDHFTDLLRPLHLLRSQALRFLLIPGMSAQKIHILEALKHMLRIRKVKLLSVRLLTDFLNSPDHGFGFSILLSAISIVTVETGLEEEPESVAEVEGV